MKIPPLPLSRANRLPNVLKKYYPEFYKYIENKYSEELVFSEKLYWYFNNLMDYPKCPHCGNPIKSFRKYEQGYSQYCSAGCAGRHTMDKMQQTCKERYGVTNPMQNREIQQKSYNTNIERYGGQGNASPQVRQRQYQTMKELYGETHAAQVPELFDKIKKTCLARYGYEVPTQNPEIMQKSINTQIERYGGVGFASEELRERQLITMKDRYGVENAMFKDEIKERLAETRSSDEFIEKWTKGALKRTQKLDPNVIDAHGTGSDRVLIISCGNCKQCPGRTSFEIGHSQYGQRRFYNEEMCPIKNPIGTDMQHNNGLERFIGNILDKYNIKYLQNYRKLIAPQEVDFYCPDHNIAIECNGCFWHSIETKNQANNYHIKKFIKCGDVNVQLLTIWEDWVRTKPEIVESLILSKFGIYKERIGARQCQIKEIDFQVSNEFCMQNHIQGSCNSSIRLGLIYKDKLVSIMTFTKNRSCMGFKDATEQNVWELTRFCSVLNTQVIGGAAKLLKYFIKNYHPDKIISYSSNDISIGNLYSQLGFQHSDKIQESYWYVHPRTYQRFHRSTFTRKGISKAWPEYDINDHSWTERSVMSQKKYYCFYDSGTLKWILNMQKKEID